ncbi:MAG TPA: phosphatase PAP2 family protein [Acidimicrobiales bacterium]|nr:phosphatase PAP2 family protein [Acidimicrobiales bacterium]
MTALVTQTTARRAPARRAADSAGEPLHPDALLASLDGGAGNGAVPATPSGPVAAFDAAVDGAFDRFRGRRAVDTAAIVLSNLGDYGYVWVLIAAAKCLTSRRGRRRTILALALSGVSSYGVNAAAKALVGRQRPAPGNRLPTGGPLGVRSPTSSSFPSGHTLAAWCTAVALADGPVELASFVGLAAAVAASRVHLQAHHASDVVGGAVLGAALGAGARVLLAVAGTGAGDGRRRPAAPT